MPPLRVSQSDTYWENFTHCCRHHHFPPTHYIQLWNSNGNWASISGGLRNIRNFRPAWKWKRL